MPSNFTYYIKSQCTLDTYNSALSLLPFELFSQQCVGWRMVWSVGIYGEAMKGGILGGDTNSTARSRHRQLMVRGTPGRVTSSRLSWVWSLSPNPLVHPLPVAASPSLEMFLRNTHLSLPLAPVPRFLSREIRGRRACYKASPTQRRWPRRPVAKEPASGALPYPARGQAFRPGALSSAPESSCLTPQALPQPSGGKQELSVGLWGVGGRFGATSGKPPSTHPRASGKRVKRLYKQWSF